MWPQNLGRTLIIQWTSLPSADFSLCSHLAATPDLWVHVADWQRVMAPDNITVVKKGFFKVDMPIARFYYS